MTWVIVLTRQLGRVSFVAVLVIPLAIPSRTWSGVSRAPVSGQGIGSAVAWPKVPKLDETPVCGQIDTNTRWTVADNPYHVTCNSEVVEGTVLTVDPGVAVKFDPNTQLVIRGSLQASGTAGQPIVFTSAAANPAAGDWVRLWFAEGHGQSLLQHVEVEYAGLYDSNSIQFNSGSLTLRESTIRNNQASGVEAHVMPTLLDNTFEDNGGAAIKLILEDGLGGHTGQIAGNTGSGNDTNGILIWGLVDDNLTLGSNEGLAYYVNSELRVAVSHKLTLLAGVVFKLGNGAINVDGRLEAMGTADNKVVFTSLRDDTFGGDTNGDGGASSPTPGDWWRISLSPGASADLHHSIIRYAGAEDTNAVWANGANLVVRDSDVQYNLNGGIAADDGVFEVADSNVSNNGSNGIRFCACTQPASPVMTGNTLASNGEFAVMLRSGESVYASPTIENNTGDGNGVNGILLDVLLNTTTLKNNQGLPYVIGSLDTVADSVLTIDAGVVLKADRSLSWPGSKIVVKGSLRVEGQADKPVVFTSLKDDAYGGDTNGDGSATQPSPGDWRGISLVGSVWNPPPPGLDHQVFLPLVMRKMKGNASGGEPPERAGTTTAFGEHHPPEDSPPWSATLDHVIVRYGGIDQGNLALFGGVVSIGNSTISHSLSRGISAEDTQLSLESTTMTQNGTDGLWLFGRDVPIAPVLVDNVFSDNGDYAAYLIFNGGCHADTEMHGNVAWGNGMVNGIYMEGYVNTPSGCRWQPNPQMPYVIWTIRVAETGRLRLDPGVEVKFVGPDLERGTGTFILAGTMTAEGTADAPIAFTSFWDDAIGGDTDGTTEPAAPGDWIGFLVRQGGHAILDHAVFRYGGANGTDLSVTDASLQLTDSEISYSANKGLGIEVGAVDLPLVVRNNAFIGNMGCAVEVWSGQSAPTSFDFGGNRGYDNGVNGIRVGLTLGTMTVNPNPTLPYVIQSLVVPEGQTVTVEPGVVFKGGTEHTRGGGPFTVEGVLEVAGSAGNPVYLTSLHDDEVGGDTLGDGSAIEPAPGDWLGLVARSGGRVNLNYSTVRFAGSDQAALVNNGGEVVVDHSRIMDSHSNGISNQPGSVATVTRSVLSRNGKRGLANGGVTNITSCDIMDNGEYGVYSYADGMISAEYNYWGSADGPGWDGFPYCTPPPAGSGDLVSCHSVDYEPFATVPYH